MPVYPGAFNLFPYFSQETLTSKSEQIELSNVDLTPHGQELREEYNPEGGFQQNQMSGLTTYGLS